MLTINGHPTRDSRLLELRGTLLVPHDDVPLLAAVSQCACERNRVVVFDLARLSRIDAGGLGALVRARALLESVGCRLALLDPTRFVRELLRRTCLDVVIPTFSTEGAYRGTEGAQSVGRELAFWRGALSTRTWARVSAGEYRKVLV